MAKLTFDKKDKSIRSTAQSLKTMFLENAEPLVQQYIDAALGTGQLKSTNAGAREEVWEVLKTLMLQSSDKLDIDIESAEDVLKAVSTGKCTFEEGEKLLNLYKKMKEINTVGMVPGSGTTGLQIIIQGSNPQVAEVPLGAGGALHNVINHEEIKDGE